MNGVPATIVISHLLSDPAPTSRRPARPARPTADRRTSRSLVLRVVAPLVVLAVVVALTVAFVLALSGSDDKAPAAGFGCRESSADLDLAACG